MPVWRTIELSKQTSGKNEGESEAENATVKEVARRKKIARRKKMIGVKTNVESKE